MAIKSFNRNQWLQRGSPAARRSIKQSEADDDYKDYLARQKAEREAAEQATNPAPPVNPQSSQESPTAH